MGRTVFLGLLAVLCTIGSLWSALAARTVPPEILKVDETQKDLGALLQQSEAKTTFLLRNVSRSEIEIFRVVTSCSCTGAVVGQLKLSPGDATQLEAKLETSTYRGPVTQTVNVLYRVKGVQTLKKLQIVLSANVIPHYDVQPEKKLVFGANHNLEQEIVVSSNDNSVIEILRAYCSHPAFTVNVVKPSGDTKLRRIRVIFDPSRWEDDSMRPIIVLETNSSLEPIHQIQVVVSD